MGGEWPSTPLGQNARKIGSGATPRGGKEAYLDAGPYALIRSQNVRDLEFKQEGLAFIDADQAAALDGVEVQSSDVLINITGDSVARVCMVDPRILPARVNQHVAIVRADPKAFHQRYVCYALVAPDVKNRLLGLASAGATRNALTKGDLEGLRLPCPPLSDQERITDLLGALDDKIELNRRMAETLQETARSLFKSWFVEFDPVRAKAEGRRTDLPDDVSILFPNRLGPDGLPQGWSSTNDALAVVERASVQPEEMPPDTPYVGLEHIDGRNLVLSRHGGASDVSSIKTRFRPGDLLFGKLRPYFHKVVIAPFAGISSSDILVFRRRQGVPLSFLALAFSEASFIDMASTASGGTRMPRADWGYLRAQAAVRPRDEVLSAFDAVAGPALNRAQETQKEARTLAALRDALLPKLISGELRIRDADRTVAAA